MLRTSKKMLPMQILDILKCYTDENHRLSQKEIVQLLERNYEVQVDRKTVKRNLMALLDWGYAIEYSESKRQNRQGEDEIIYSDWYLIRDFSDAELRLLIDGVLASKNIPHKQGKELVSKLGALSNQYFHTKVKHISRLTENRTTNTHLFLNIEILDEAISANKQVCFHYNKYDIDKKMHPRRRADNEIIEYLINPYQIAITNGRYYLIGNVNHHDNIAHFRVDQITDMRLLPSKAKPIREVIGDRSLNLPKHMVEHIYMFAGESKRVTFRAKRYMVTAIIDWFGLDVEFFNETHDEVDVSVMVNEKGMHYWALQYGPHIRVLTPQSLVDDLKKDIAGMVEKYEIGKE